MSCRLRSNRKLFQIPTLCSFSRSNFSGGFFYDRLASASFLFVLLAMRLFRLLPVVFAFFGLQSSPVFAQKKDQIDSLYHPGIIQASISNPDLAEISGLAFSKKHPNLMYVHTDSGGEPTVTMLDSLGRELGKIELEDAKNRDWEDIAVGPGPDGKSYVYVGEIGDNAGVHKEILIYRFPEPSTVQKTQSAKVEILRLTYPNGPRDAESLMVDPISGDLFILSKRDDKNSVYCVSQDAFAQGKAVLKQLHNLNFTGSVAGDISQDGSRILVKNYFAVFYWERKTGESIGQALERKPKRLPYVPEPQGEAIGFNRKGSSFFTLSEKRFNINPTLYRYPRK